MKRKQETVGGERYIVGVPLKYSLSCNGQNEVLGGKEGGVSVMKEPKPKIEEFEVSHRGP